MTATVETKIWMALRARIDALPLTFLKAWPKEEFTPPTEGGTSAPYLEIAHLPNAVQRPFIGHDDPNWRTGILQISLMYPVALKHHGEVDIQYAGQIAAHFNQSVTMPYDDVVVGIERSPDVAQGYRDGVYWRTPVSIRWQASA